MFLGRFQYFFSLTWKFDGDSKSDIVLHFKWFTGPQKFVIMIRCKTNFDIIWYTVIFLANLYWSIFVWSSDILNFFLWMLSFLFFYVNAAYFVLLFENFAGFFATADAPPGSRTGMSKAPSGVKLLNSKGTSSGSG